MERIVVVQVWVWGEMCVWGKPPAAGPPSPGPGHDHFQHSEIAWDSHPLQQQVVRANKIQSTTEKPGIKTDE